MDIAELKNKNESELLVLLSELRSKFRNLKFEIAQGKISNIRVIRETKKDIARILTILRKTKHAAKV
ncbi:MAG: 50S ribosomal protein L29 [Parcubacteria group bacterium]|nr:50S ribosomal protein L29 [Parcubacteria group bacterium]